MPIVSCSSTPLGAVRADYCTDGVVFGPFDRMYFTKVGDGLTDWTQLAEWTGRLDNATPAPSTGDAPIRYLNIIGTLAEPDVQETEISLGRIKTAPPDYTVAITVDDTGELNYEFMQSLIDAGGGQYAVWLEGHTYLYGGNDGIQASLVLYETVPESRTETVKLVGRIRWKGSMPDRIISPLTT